MRKVHMAKWIFLKFTSDLLAIAVNTVESWILVANGVGSVHLGDIYIQSPSAILTIVTENLITITSSCVQLS